MIFVVAMIALGVVGTGIAVYEGNYGSAVAGSFTAYLVYTAYTTLRPPTGRYARAVAVALMMIVFGVALFQLWAGMTALATPSRSRAGVPAAMILFIGTVTLLAATGDWRLLRAGSIEGTRRIARHLWRMCFGLFIASGSFFLGQMKFLPESLRIIPLLVVLGVAPLVVLIYWMWRVRLRGRLHGMTLRADLTSRAATTGLATPPPSS